MKLPLATVLFTLISLLVPSIQAQQSTEPQQEGKSTICFYRPHRFEGSALKPSIYIDNSEIARLKNGESVNVTVPAGQHRVYSNDKATGIDLDAQPGQTYYVRMDIQTGVWKGHGGITLVDPQEGKYESAQTKLETSSDLSNKY